MRFVSACEIACSGLDNTDYGQKYVYNVSKQFEAENVENKIDILVN